MRLTVLCCSLLILISGSATAQQAPFSEWLAALRAEAEGQGVSAATLDTALAGIEPDPEVIRLDRHQPEFTQTFQRYIELRVSETRVRRGLEQKAAHWPALERVGQAYGVQPRFILAIWGLETNYGSFTGGKGVVRSLATLAYDERRSAYFRRELLNALKILDEGHIDAAAMKGSWAGAMGQSQFMPSSFLDYAEDFDGDGRRDIWLTEIDVFASIANYLSRYGWRNDMTWGRPVMLPVAYDNFAPQLMPAEEPKSCRRALKSHTDRFPLARWQELGIRRLNGDDLPTRDFSASMVRPAGAGGPAFLTYANYRTILRYNCSNYYAISVGMLANRLR